jgi:sterol carrier protein 2
LGLTGIPITNVNNNCSTGSTAFYQGNTLVKAGAAECVMALGFERMAPGSLGTNFPDRPGPTKPLNEAMLEIEQTTLGVNKGPGAPRLFGNGATEYFKKFGGGIEHLAQIGRKTTPLEVETVLSPNPSSGQEPQTLCEQPIFSIQEWVDLRPGAQCAQDHQ